MGTPASKHLRCLLTPLLGSLSRSVAACPRIHWPSSCLGPVSDEDTTSAPSAHASPERGRAMASKLLILMHSIASSFQNQKGEAWPWLQIMNLRSTSSPQRQLAPHELRRQSHVDGISTSCSSRLLTTCPHDQPPPFSTFHFPSVCCVLPKSATTMPPHFAFPPPLCRPRPNVPVRPSRKGHTAFRKSVESFGAFPQPASPPIACNTKSHQMHIYALLCA